MTQITEDYVSYEIAKLLKEKGFDEKVHTFYISETEIVNTNIKHNYNGESIYLSAPTCQMAMKWLREVYNIYLQFEPYWTEGDMRNPCNWYWIWTSLKNIYEADRPSYGGRTYEEAVEAAIKWCLENLI